MNEKVLLYLILQLFLLLIDLLPQVLAKEFKHRLAISIWKYKLQITLTLLYLIKTIIKHADYRTITQYQTFVL